MRERRATCAQCGKLFVVTSPKRWVYRDGTVYYCGWRCIREHDVGIPPHRTAVPEEIPQVMPEETAERIRRQVDEKARQDVERQPVTPSAKKREYKKNLSAQKIMRVMTTMARVKTALSELSAEVEALK